ncbi:MAG: hypothetical protein WC714_27600 [Candidatus Obscuribacterales bacterium]
MPHRTKFMLPLLALASASTAALFGCPPAGSADSISKTTASTSKLASADGKDSFRVFQHSKPSGEEEIWVSPHGIKIINLRNRYYSLFTKPYTEVHSYNSKTKKIFTIPIKKYKSPYASSMALLKAITFTEIKTSKYKEATYKGCSANYSNIPKDVMLQRMKERSTGDLVSRAPLLFEIVTSNKLVIAPPAARLVYLYYGLPQKTGIPFDMSYETFGRKKHQYLTTDRVEAKSFKASDFLPPSNYIKAKNDGDVLLDNDSEGSMNLMIMDH